MSYKNLEKVDEFRVFLEAALEDLGYKVTILESYDIRIEDRKGNTRDLTASSVFFLMGAVVAEIGKILKETE